METVGGKSVVYLRNGEERLKLDEITTAGDSTHDYAGRVRCGLSLLLALAGCGNSECGPLAPDGLKGA